MMLIIIYVWGLNMHTPRYWLSKFAITILFVAAAKAAQADVTDLTELSLEQLMQVEVSSASKYMQRSSDAPSAIQVITREEIQLHGWRTLTEALVNLPGIYANNDRVYDFLGARGFLVPGDYNTRFLLLIDGQRNNDNIYQQALTGSEGWLDMSMVERIEYVPGPGSAIYGSNAMFGVINVITRSAKMAAQSEAGAHVSQLGLSGVNVMTSQTVGETGLLMQYSAERQADRDQTYSDPNGFLLLADGSVSPDGVAHGLDSGNNRRVMMRVDRNEWSFKLVNHRRTVTPSSAPYWTAFDDPSVKILDEGTQIFASVQHELSASSSVYARLGYTNWSYQGAYPFPADPVTPAPYFQNYDDVRGRTVDGEFRYQLKGGTHQLLGGLEFSRDMEAKQSNFYSDPAVGPTVNINPLIQRSSLFIQDEWRIDQSLLLSLGLRMDKATGTKPSRSPRLGLIWQPAPAWTAKLLTGRAFRTANAYESQFTDGVNYLSNPDLQAETITTTEGVVEWLGKEKTRLQMSVYENKLENLIRQVDTGGLVFQYQNGEGIKVRGLEVGLEKTTAADLKLRASISASRPEDIQGTRPGNSPSWLAKAGVSAPIFNQVGFLAAEVHAIGSRSYTWNATPYQMEKQTVTNATLTFPNVLTKGMQLQLRVTNLFDRNIQHPAAEEMPTATIPQNGRNLMAKLDYAF